MRCVYYCFMKFSEFRLKYGGVIVELNITHKWSLRNTVVQAEILALLKALEHASVLPTQQLTILVGNKASIQSAANPKSQNTIVRKIFK
ncbi:hypothetical protein AVEN_146505-1 [Araneus ventricosus]|uniref:RNase H type-1 domain-containing protein n=1 Tax=Araneus ventricosus TaxID=182803 RepID=A0A4Y2S0J2_ARAVE|nr:hypothetical protein AVEN_85828-1 [Araneus ventricosus]GBN81116.1 hypothetical protein AVEN_146505-1 [Araneus ventricosus]